ARNSRCRRTCPCPIPATRFADLPRSPSSRYFFQLVEVDDALDTVGGSRTTRKELYPSQRLPESAPVSTLPDSRRWTRPRSQRAPQFPRIENRRLAGKARAHHCKRPSVKRSSPAERRKIRDRPRQSRWQILRDSLVGVQAQNRPTQPQRPHRSPVQLRGHLIFPDYHHLRVRLAEVHHRQPVSSRKNPVLSRDTGI